MRQVTAGFHSEHEVLWHAVVPACHQTLGRQLVKAVVDFNGLKPRGVIFQPETLRKCRRIEVPAPMPILPARATDIDPLPPIHYPNVAGGDEVSGRGTSSILGFSAVHSCEHEGHRRDTVIRPLQTWISYGCPNGAATQFGQGLSYGTARSRSTELYPRRQVASVRLQQFFDYSVV